MTVPGSVPKPSREEKDASANNRLPADGQEANQIIARARTGQAAIESLSFRNRAYVAAAAL